MNLNKGEDSIIKSVNIRFCNVNVIYKIITF